MYLRLFFSLAMLCSFQVIAEPLLMMNRTLSIEVKESVIDGVFNASVLSDDDGDVIRIGLSPLDSQGSIDLETMFGKRVARVFEKKFKQVAMEGRGAYPEEFGDYRRLIDWLVETPNSIGLIDSDFYSYAKSKGLSVVRVKNR